MKKNRILKSILVILIITLGLSLTACSTRNVKTSSPTSADTGNSSTNKASNSKNNTDKDDSNEPTSTPAVNDSKNESSPDSNRFDQDNNSGNSDDMTDPNYNKEIINGAIDHSSSSSIIDEELITEQQKAYKDTINDIINNYSDSDSDSVSDSDSDSVTWRESKKTNTCSIIIDCSNALAYDAISKSLLDNLPSDGVIFYNPEFEFTLGETVFDVLYRATRSSGIPLEFTDGAKYIEGINSLYEFDCGSLSGWTYSVDGKKPNYSCDEYKVSSGSDIQWKYTLNSGKDTDIN